MFNLPREFVVQSNLTTKGCTMTIQERLLRSYPIMLVMSAALAGVLLAARAVLGLLIN